MGPRARIAAVTVVVCLAAGTPGAPARAGDLAPPVPNVPSVLPDATGVMAFENRSGVQGLGWMSAGAAFLVGEKVEAARALRPVFGPLVVPPGPPVAASPASVAAYAGKSGARWVWTGWVKRPDWELQVGIALWRVDGGAAVQVGEVVRRGEFGKLSDFSAEAITELMATAGMPLGPAQRARVERRPTSDFY